MPRATYALEVETSHNTWTAITADWHTGLPLIIERGMPPGSALAGVGTMSLTLRSYNGKYVPDHAGLLVGFHAGARIRLTGNDGTTDYPLFNGRIAAIMPWRDTGATRWPGRVDLHCEDEMAALLRQPLTAFPLLINAAPRAIVNRLIDSAFTPPGLAAYWQLEHPDAGKLGQGTKLPDEDTGKAFDDGQSIFPWAGDTWPGGIALLSALRDVCHSEGGLFYIAADGTPIFADRHQRPKQVTADATLSGSLRGLLVEHRISQVANDIEVTIYPREIGSTTEILWESSSVIRLDPGIPREVIAHYRDPDQAAEIIGALDVIAPLKSVDYTASQNPDGSGADRTGFVKLDAEIGATAVHLTLTSLYPEQRPIYVQTLRVRGTPLRAYQPAVVRTTDIEGRFEQGILPLHIDMPLQEDFGIAVDTADAARVSRKDTQPWLTLRVEAAANQTTLTHALARDIGDRLHVTDAVLALSSTACFIDHIRHEIHDGGASHRVVWQTSPAAISAFWLLGKSGYAELGEGSRTGY